MFSNKPKVVSYLLTALLPTYVFMSVLTIILQGDNKMTLNSKHKSSRDNRYLKMWSRPDHIICKSSSASALLMWPQLSIGTRGSGFTRGMFYCDVLSSAQSLSAPSHSGPRPALFASKYMYYKQNFLVVKLLECFKLCSLRPPDSYSCPPSKYFKPGDYLMLCVEHLKKLFELVLEIND